MTVPHVYKEIYTDILELFPYPGTSAFHKVFADHFPFLIRLLVGFVVVIPPVISTTSSILSEAHYVS